MEWLWMIIVICFILVLFYITHIANTYRRNYYHNQINQIEIEGIYMNESMTQRSEIYKDNTYYRHHKQNTSSVVDILWEEVPTKCMCHHNPCTCPKTFHDLSNQHKKAIVTLSSIHIYEDDKCIETLQRSTTVCPISPTPPPSKATLHLYEIVSIKPEEQEQFITVLNNKRVCATQNDWNLTNTSILVKGFFIMDSAGTCFYTVSNEQMEIVLSSYEKIPSIMPRIISINEIENRTFLGAMIIM